MKYCRYCSNCITCEHCYYCEEREITLSPKQIRRPTTCPAFHLSFTGDVDTGRRYRPKKEKSAVSNVGISLF